MDQAPFEPSKSTRGGDTRPPQARVDIARREEQIVALRLRHIPFAAIARTVGVNKSNAIRAFNKALRRNTDQDISTHHRSELAELDAQPPRAKVDIAKREQQIVALKLRGIAPPEIARVIGISLRAVHAAFNKALRRQTMLRRIRVGSHEQYLKV
jgi:DNA-binding CsgD family transcriptional regulator